MPQRMHCPPWCSSGRFIDLTNVDWDPILRINDVTHARTYCWESVDLFRVKGGDITTGHTCQTAAGCTTELKDLSILDPSSAVDSSSGCHSSEKLGISFVQTRHLESAPMTTPVYWSPFLLGKVTEPRRNLNPADQQSLPAFIHLSPVFLIFLLRSRLFPVCRRLPVLFSFVKDATPRFWIIWDQILSSLKRLLSRIERSLGKN